MENVTVIIPTYNREKTIQRAIESVLGQTYKQLKIIVVDDASTDETETIVSEMINRHSNLFYHKQEHNKGACAARNYGIRWADTEYIAFLDSDDAWFPEKIEKQLHFLKEKNADVVICSVMRVETDAQHIFPDKLHAGNMYRDLLRGNFVSTGMIFGKRECFLELFDESLPRLQDWDMMIRVAKKYSVYHDHVALAYYYIQSDSISFNHQKLKTAAQIIYHKYQTEFQQDAVALSNICDKCAVGFIMTSDSNAKIWARRALRAKVSLKRCLIWLACELHMGDMLKAVEEIRLKKRCNS